jgi:hypothetical protein
MLLMVMDAVPLLVRVTTFCAPLPPTETDTQFKEAGDTETCAIRAAHGMRRQAAPIRNAQRRKVDASAVALTRR